MPSSFRINGLYTEIKKQYIKQSGKYVEVKVGSVKTAGVYRPYHTSAPPSITITVNVRRSADFHTDDFGEFHISVSSATNITRFLVFGAWVNGRAYSTTVPPDVAEYYESINIPLTVDTATHRGSFTSLPGSSRNYSVTLNPK